jgi:hypothetical protein
MRTARIVTVVLTAGVIAALPASPAHAACHRFRFDQDAYSVKENAGSVTITVSRDNGFAPSSIQYNTVDGTAKAGQDYTAKSGTLSYSTEISMSFSVPITNDTKDEPNETFQVRLHDPSGCAPNPNFDVDGPSTVTIQDDDAAPQPTPTGTSTSSPAASPTQGTSPPATPTQSPSASPSPAAIQTSPGPSVTETAAPPLAQAPSGGGGGLSGGAIGAIVAAVVVGGAAALLVRRRFLT